MHFRVAARTAGMQSRALAGIKDRFHTPKERPPDQIDWNAVMAEVRATAGSPVARNELNLRLKMIMPQLLQQAQQATEEQ